MNKALLHKKPCPRCGCYLMRFFECGCGQVHDNICGNCGRWSSLPVDEHVDLSPFDVQCEAGAVDHEHPSEQKTRHIKDVFDARRQQ